MKQQQGFTLIELIVVIVILGILAATAVPKFVNIKSDAELAAINGVGGAVNSAFAVNYAGYIVNAAKGTQIAGANVTVSAAAGSIMQGGIPTGYVVSATATTVACGTTAGLTFPLTVSNSTAGFNTATAAATLICTG